MSDLISRSELLKEFEWLLSVEYEYQRERTQDAIQRIKNAPAVDAVPVVRCKDCAVWLPPLKGTSSLTQTGKCEYTGYSAEADDYCSFADCICGERNNDETAVLKQALDKYGAEAQTLMVFEEMAELQKELCKHARGADNRENIAEEIADVLIMLDQMMILHDCAGAVAEYRQRKITRLAEILKEDN